MSIAISLTHTIEEEGQFIKQSDHFIGRVRGKERWIEATAVRDHIVVGKSLIRLVEITKRRFLKPIRNNWNSLMILLET